MTDMIQEIKSINDMAVKMDERLVGYGQRFEKIEGAISDLQKSAAYGSVGGATVSPEVKSMIDYMAGRTNEVKAAAAATTGAVLNPVNGGYLAVEEYANRVIEKVIDGNPLAQEVEMFNINANILGVPVERELPEATFIGELQAVNPSTPKLGMVNIPVKQLACKVPLTRVLLQSSNVVDVEAYTMNRVSKAISDKLGKVILEGDGVNQPQGILGSKALATVKSGASKGFTEDQLFEAMGKIPEAVDGNAKWFMNKRTFFQIAGIVGKDSNYVHMGLSQGIPRSLFGYPVVLCDSMPAVADGSTSVIFGDMRTAYKAVQAGGLEYFRDPYTDSDQGVVNMRFWTGLGGALVRPEAIVGIKVGA